MKKTSYRVSKNPEDAPEVLQDDRSLDQARVEETDDPIANLLRSFRKEADKGL